MKKFGYIIPKVQGKCDPILGNQTKSYIRQNQTNTTVLLVSSLNFTLPTQGWF